MKIFSVSKKEKDFKQHKQGSSQEGLIQAVKKGWGSTLKDSMSNELQDPGNKVDCKGNFPDWKAMNMSIRSNLWTKISTKFPFENVLECSKKYLKRY
jgi:hypothetical protein